MDWKYAIGIGGALATWIWSVFTWLKLQAAQRAQNEFQRKEALYRELLRALTGFYRDGTDSAVALFLEHVRLAWLYAPDEVIHRLYAFLNTQRVEVPPTEKNERGKETMAEAVAAIRRDLFSTAGRTTMLTSADFGHY